MAPQDEGLLLVYPDLILQGRVPNRDFATFYTPGAMWTIATGFWLFGKSVFVERAVALLFHLAILGAIVRIGSHVGTFACFLAAVGACSGIALSGPAALSIFGALAAGMWALAVGYESSLKVERGGGTWLFFLSGLLAGIAVVFRQDIGAVTIIAASAFPLSSRRPKQVLAFIGGGIVGVLPLMVHAIVAGPHFLLENYFFDILRNAPGRKLPLEFSRWLVILAALEIAIIISTVGIWLLRLRRDITILASSLSIFALLLVPSAIQRLDMWHFAYVSTVILPIAILVIVIFMRAVIGRYKIFHEPAPMRRACLALIPIATVLWIGFIYYKSAPFQIITSADQLGRKISNGDRSILVDRSRGDELAATIQEGQRLRSGASLFIGPVDLRRTNYGDTFLYFVLPNLQPASYYLEMNPGVANRKGSRLASDLKKADYLLLTSEYDDWNEPNDSSLFGDAEAVDVVRRNFCDKYIFGRYRLLERC